MNNIKEVSFAKCLQNCIMRKVKEEKLKVCPECNTDLGAAPSQKIRPDHQVQGIRDIVSSKRREFIERGLIEKSIKDEPKKLAREDIDINKSPEMLIDTPPSCSSCCCCCYKFKENGEINFFHRKCYTTC
ncbi:hypothetical protein KY284_000899 [Solanum tuberosum]|nr:hypothetical protein KY284_000899 [Solanum tuberosum]